MVACPQSGAASFRPKKTEAIIKACRAVLRPGRQGHVSNAQLVTRWQHLVDTTQSHIDATYPALSCFLHKNAAADRAAQAIPTYLRVCTDPTDPSSWTLGKSKTVSDDDTERLALRILQRDSNGPSFRKAGVLNNLDLARALPAPDLQTIPSKLKIFNNGRRKPTNSLVRTPKGGPNIGIYQMAEHTSVLHKALSRKAAPFSEFTTKDASARLLSLEFSSAAHANLLHFVSEWSRERPGAATRCPNFTGILARTIPLVQLDTVRAIHYRSINVRHRIQHTPGVVDECPWCSMNAAPNISETITHRFYDCPLTKTIWTWVDQYVFPPKSELPHHPYERISGDIQTKSPIFYPRQRRPASLIWYILHASVCHNIYKVTRHPKLSTRHKLKIIATIKARIISDLAHAARADWHAATSHPREMQHAQIVKFANTWCSDAQGYPAARVNIRSGGSEFSLENPDSNLHVPTLHLDFNNLTARPPRPGDTFLAGLRARQLARRTLAGQMPAVLFPGPAANPPGAG